ncbi:MAG: MlaD family protein [Phycisphaerales bacterium]
MGDDRSRAQQIQAGVGVIAVIGVACAGVWLWTILRDRQRTEYTVRFTAQQGVYGLRPGAAVRIGGLPRGRVEEIEPIIESGSIAFYDVRIMLRGDTPLYRGVQVEATGGGTSGESAIEFHSLGRVRNLAGSLPNADRDSGVLPPGSVIQAVDPPPFRDTFGSEGGRSLRALSERFSALRTEYAKIFDELPAKAGPLKDDWTALVARVREDYPAWRRDFESARESAARAIEALGAGKDPAPDAVIPNLRAARDDFGALEKLNTSRASFSYAALRHAVDKISALRERGGALADAVRDSEHALGAANADFSITGQELAATESEILSAPWKLFASPDAAQRAEAWRIEQARAFAQAATEFSRAMDAIVGALERDGKLLAEVPGLAELLRTRTDAAAAQFRGQTDRFARMLLGEPEVSPRTPSTPDPAPHAP